VITPIIPEPLRARHHPVRMISPGIAAPGPRPTYVADTTGYSGGTIVGTRHLVAGLTIACVALIAAGCSSGSSSSSSSSTTPKQKVCADKDALQSSAKHLVDPSVLSGGKSSINSALDDVNHDLDSLKTSAKASLQPQVDAVQSAVDQLKTAVQGFGSGSLASNISKATDAGSKVVSSAGKLASSLADQCPS
jgi:hypothetical protein